MNGCGSFRLGYVGTPQKCCRNVEALLASSEEVMLEGKADKTKCVVMRRGKKAGKFHSIKTGRHPSENVTTFKYLRNTLKH